jgi:hypothetical protein
MVPFFMAEGNADRQTRIAREFWFDRDIDGRWLVCAVKPDVQHPRVDGGDTYNLGAIVVTDSQVIAFIEMLGELIADPAQFGEEPTFVAFPQDDHEQTGRHDD